MTTPKKKLSDQVIVITGATSGIGLATARLAASRGARLVLCSRNERELKRLAQELPSAICVTADVAAPEAVDTVARRAIEAFGGFDTWVNNAGVTIYGKLTEVSLDEKRRLFDVNFWGVVHGCRAAVRHLRERGGVIINMGSITSERAIPLQGIYAASKHAIQAYTDALRMELEHDGAPIRVSLIKPAAIDTPYIEHARNHLDVEPRNVPPYYSPRLVAEAVLACAEHPRRDVLVGGAAKALSLLEKISPRLTDKMMESAFFRLQRTHRPLQPELGRSALFHPPHFEGREMGQRPAFAFRHSLYTDAVLHPLAGALIATGAVLAGWALLRVTRAPERIAESSYWAEEAA